MSGNNGFANEHGYNYAGDQMRQGVDVNLPLQVSLEDLYNGKLFTVRLIDLKISRLWGKQQLRRSNRVHVKKVAHRRQVLCPKCRGTGAKRPEDVKTCSECDGKGVKIETKRVGPGFIQQTQVTCPVCNGKGMSVTSKCSYCHGDKVHIGEEELFVEIERGMPNNHQIRFKHKADEAPDVNPGDLVFHLTTRQHFRFSRDGNNLHIKEPITLLEALTGFNHLVKHLDGHEFSISRSDITIPGISTMFSRDFATTIKTNTLFFEKGFVEKVAGEGMPIHEVPSQKGDLFVEYVVIFPKKLTAAQKEGTYLLVLYQNHSKLQTLLTLLPQNSRDSWPK